MDSQRLHPQATGELTGLLNELIVAAKTISAEVNMAGLADILGMSGKTNIQGEHVQKLDEFSNNTIKRRMARSGYLCVMTSEEEADTIPVAPGYEGKYTLAFDPLDGSSNIDVNVNIGTIFSIHRRRSPDGGPCEESDLLQPGRDQVAAGYVIYGSSTMLVFSTGEGVQGFTLDPSVGEFYLSHPDSGSRKRANITASTRVIPATGMRRPTATSHTLKKRTRLAVGLTAPATSAPWWRISTAT